MNQVDRSQANAFKCALCGDTFPTNGALVKHKSVHEKEQRTFVCKCGQSFTDHREFLLHEVTHMYFKDTRECAECGETKSKISLSTHILTHFKQWKETCEVCGVVLLKDEMMVHAKKHSSFKKYFKCSVCQKKVCESKRTCHMHTHTEPRKTYPCEYCGKILLYKYEYSSHVNMHLGVMTEICDECGFQSHSPKLMHEHMKKHKLPGKYVCEYCKETMHDRQKFLLHACIKIRKNRHKCKSKKCNFAAPSESELKNHMGRMHFYCRICRKSFANFANLIKHRSTYSHVDNKNMDSP